MDEKECDNIKIIMMCTAICECVRVCIYQDKVSIVGGINLTLHRLIQSNIDSLTLHYRMLQKIITTVIIF